MRLRVACAAGALACAAIADASPRAAPGPSGWSAPAPVLAPPPRTQLDYPSLAFTRSGRALATWDYQLANGHSGQRAAAWRSDGTLARARDLHTRIGLPLVYKRDRAFALVDPRYGAARRLRVVFGSTNGRFGPERTIYTSGPDTRDTFTRSTANERGDIAVVRRTTREDRSQLIVLLERPSGGRFGRPRIVAELAPCRCWLDPIAIAVALGPRGELAVAYEAAESIVVRTRPAGGRLGPAVTLGRASEAASLEAAVSARGAVWVTWFDNPADGGTGFGSMTVLLAVRPAGASRFGSARKLDDVDDVWQGLATGARLALDPRGAGFVMWTTPGPRSGPRVRLATANPRGRDVRVRVLSGPDGRPSARHLATSTRRGGALVVWRELYDDKQEHARIMARLVRPDGSLGAIETVSSSGFAGEPAAAFDPTSGRAIVLWEEALPGRPSRSVLLASARGAR